VYTLSIKNFPNFGHFVFVSYDSVEQYHVRVEKAEKQARLMHLLSAETPERASLV
jgi:hypothetical protein